jgi:hypothetical protein
MADRFNRARSFHSDVHGSQSDRSEDGANPGMSARFNRPAAEHFSACASSGSHPQALSRQALPAHLMSDQEELS